LKFKEKTQTKYPQPVPELFYHEASFPPFLVAMQYLTDLLSTDKCKTFYSICEPSFLFTKYWNTFF